MIQWSFWKRSVVIGGVMGAGLLIGMPSALAACGPYQFDVIVPAGGTAYTLAHGAGAGITANAELTSEGNPAGGYGLPLWGQFVTNNSKSPLGSADALYVDSCNPNMWYNSGSYQQVQLSVNEQLDGLVSIQAQGIYYP